MLEYFRVNLNVQINSLHLSRIQGFLNGVSRIKIYILENHISIVHTQGIRADGFIKNINIPKISTIRNYPYYDYPSKFGKLLGNFMVYNHMNTIKTIRRNCIACSRTISKEFEKNNLDLKYIQNGVDTDLFFALEKPEKNKLKGKLNIHTNKKIFISVGNLIIRKDVKTVINGFKIHNKNYDSILLILGDGPEKEYLKTIANNNIIFLENISNVVEYLQVSDCFISASLAEGLPNTVLEAMACGLPTILSDIPSHRELYENEDIEFFGTKNIKELSSLLKNASNNFEIYKELSLKLIDQNFSAKMMSEKYQKIYEEKIYEEKISEK